MEVLTLKLSIFVVFLVALLNCSQFKIAFAQSTTMYYYSQQNWSTPVREADAQIVRIFEQQNPDIKVAYRFISGDQMKKDIQSYLTVALGPDVITWYSGRVAREFMKKGLFRNITSLWERQNFTRDWPNAIKKLCSGDDGAQYFLTLDYYNWAIYYRKSIFQKFNLQEPTTWQQLMDVCATLKINGIIPFTIGTLDPWLLAGWFDYLNMRVNGPDFHIDLCDGNVPYNSEQIRNVFKYWEIPRKLGYFVSNANVFNYVSAIEPFAKGEAAMYLMGDFFRNSLSPEVLNDTDFFRFPIINSGVPLGEEAPADGVGISTNSLNPEAAERFLSFLGSDFIQTFRLNVTTLPANSKTAATIIDPIKMKATQLIQSASRITQFYDRDTLPEMASRGMKLFVKWWNDPDDLDTILQTLESSRQEIFFQTISSPVVFPDSGSSMRETPFTFNIVATSPNSTIYFTLDGSKPNMDSQIFLGPITIYSPGRLVVRAFASIPGFKPSPEVQATWTLIDGNFEHLSGDVAYGVFAGLAALNVIFTFLFMAINIYFWNTSLFIAGSNVFLMTGLCGFLLIFLSIIVMGLDTHFVAETTAGGLCQLRVWFLGLGYMLLFMSMLVKAWRVNKIFNRKRSGTFKLKDKSLLKLLLIGLGVEILFNSLWNGLDPLHIHSVSFPGLTTETCTSKNLNVWLGVGFSYKGLLLVFGMWLSWQTRNALAQFNESKLILFSVYNTAFTAAILIPLSVTGSVNPKTSHIIQAIGILYCGAVNMFIMYLPRSYAAIFYPELNVKKSNPKGSGSDEEDVSRPYTDVNYQEKEMTQAPPS